MSSKRKSPPNKLSNANAVTIEKNNFKKISLKNEELIKSSPVKELNCAFDTSFLAMQKLSADPKFLKHDELLAGGGGGTGGGEVGRHGHQDPEHLVPIEPDFQYNLPFLNVASYILKGSDPGLAAKADNFQLTMNLDNLNISPHQHHQHLHQPPYHQQQQHPLHQHQQAHHQHLHQHSNNNSQQLHHQHGTPLATSQPKMAQMAASVAAAAAQAPVTTTSNAPPRKLNNMILNHLKSIVDNFDCLNNNNNNNNNVNNGWCALQGIRTHTHTR